MKAGQFGDQFIPSLLVLWMSVAVGPWWVGLGIFVVAWVVNVMVLSRLLNFSRVVEAAGEAIQEAHAAKQSEGPWGPALMQEPKCDCGDNEPPPAGPSGPCPIHGKEKAKDVR